MVRTRKGGYQISLGMIVGVVFAIILLTLGINWIIGTMKSVSELSEGILSQAKANLLKSATDKVTVVKAKSSIKANEEIEAAVIVANRYSTPKKFLIKLEGDEISKFIITPESLLTSGKTIDSILPDKGEELPFRLKLKKEALIDIPDNDYKSYFFTVKVYVCDVNSASCQATPNNLYAQKSFILEVRGRG